MSENNVVVKQQDAVEIFMTSGAGICISQESEFHGHQEIFFHLEYAELVANAILDLYRKERTGE